MFLRFSMLTLVMILVNGCATNSVDLLLSADFESDTPGNPPNFSLPEEPANDRLNWNGNTSGEPVPITIVDKPATEDNPASKQLRVLSVANPASARLSFIPNRDLEPANVYAIQWEGMLQAQQVSQSAVVLSVITGPSHESVHADFGILLRPAGGTSSDFPIDVFLLDGFGVVGDQIGTLQNDKPHSVTISVDIEARTFTIVGGNSGNIRTGPKRFSSTLTTLEAPIFRMQFVDPNAGVTNYFFEDVTINKIR